MKSEYIDVLAYVGILILAWVIINLLDGELLWLS